MLEGLLWLCLLDLIGQELNEAPATEINQLEGIRIVKALVVLNHSPEPK